MNQTYRLTVFVRNRPDEIGWEYEFSSFRVAADIWIDWIKAGYLAQLGVK